MIDLNTLWFLLVGGLFAGYAVLDGFDLGVGALYLLVGEDEERRLLLNSIGPVWDGNEVWLVVGGGALFAAFPRVYATVFSGFYLAMMLILVALIFRGLAIEFRGQQPMRWWRQLWDVSFSAGSIGAALLMGIALGNLIRGIPIDAAGQYSAGLPDLLRPYPLLVGITTLALFAMHGAIYLLLRVEGDLHEKVRRWVIWTIVAFVVCYVATTIATMIEVPAMGERALSRPLFLGVPVVTVAAILNIPREVRRRRGWPAFLSSCVVVFGLMALVGIGMYPNLATALDPARSLTIYNAASTPATLRRMALMAAIAGPFVALYTVSIYRVFSGKVKLDASSY
ncbi:MAG: cytochrome d ubiquinol oxidase subunit II [Steroidobacteraceae bacterium]